MDKKPHLLFLNQLSDQLLKDNFEIRVSCEPIIEFTKLNFDRLDLGRDVPWVFTSSNASMCFEEAEFPSKVYAVGTRTAVNIPNAIIPQRNTAIDLAELIIKNKENEIVFICGENRSSDLPERLINAGIKVKEVKAYTTRILNKNIDLDGVDALAFMSPSSVRGFALNGGFKNLPCFAIGPSTEQELISHGQYPILSKKSSAESIIEKAIEYLIWHSPIKETED